MAKTVRFKRTAIHYPRNREGLYVGMPGTITHFGRTFKCPGKESRKQRAQFGIKMFECFGRTQIRLTEKEKNVAMKRRIEYLKRFGPSLVMSRQTITTNEEKQALRYKHKVDRGGKDNAVSSNESDVGGVRSKKRGSVGKGTKHSDKVPVRKNKKRVYRRRKVRRDKD